MPRPSPYLFSAWVIAWLAEQAFASEPYVIVAERGGELVGFAPFALRLPGARAWRRSRARTSRRSATSCSRPGEPPETARMLLGALPGLGHGRARRLRPARPTASCRAAAGSRMRVIERVESPVTEMPDGWEEAYKRHTSSNRRNQDRRRERQLERARQPRDVARHHRRGRARDLPDAFALHHMRWQGRPDGSTFGLPAGQRFQRAALPQLADEGRFAMLTLRLDGRPIAFHCWFVAGSSIYLHRNAFDASLSRYGPGLVALRRSLAAASERGARRVEYLGGAEQFKRDLADRFEPLHQGFGLARGAGRSRLRRARAARDRGAQAPQAQRAPAPPLSIRRAPPAPQRNAS